MPRSDFGIWHITLRRAIYHGLAAAVLQQTILAYNQPELTAAIQFAHVFAQWPAGFELGPIQVVAARSLDEDGWTEVVH